MTFASAVIDGVFCQDCGQYVGEAVGFSVTCSDCRPPHKRNPKMSKLFNGIQYLQERGVKLKTSSSEHSRITTNCAHEFEVWPSTGSWFNRTTKQHGKGLDLVIAALGSTEQVKPTPAQPGATAKPTHLIQIHIDGHCIAVSSDTLTVTDASATSVREKVERAVAESLNRYFDQAAVGL